MCLGDSFHCLGHAFPLTVLAVLGYFNKVCSAINCCLVAFFLKKNQFMTFITFLQSDLEIVFPIMSHWYPLHEVHLWRMMKGNITFNSNAAKAWRTMWEIFPVELSLISNKQKNKIPVIIYTCKGTLMRWAQHWIKSRDILKSEGIACL